MLLEHVSFYVSTTLWFVHFKPVFGYSEMHIAAKE